MKLEKEVINCQKNLKRSLNLNEARKEHIDLRKQRRQKKYTHYIYSRQHFQHRLKELK